MDNFIIGTFRENINLIFHNLHLIQDTIPKKLSHLTDLAGKWTVNANGDIVPEISGTLNIGSIDKSVKSLFLSENSLHIVKPNTNGDKVSVKFGVSEDNGLEITQEILSDTQSDGNLQQIKNDPLTVPSKTQLLFSEAENSILINAVKTVVNTGVNFTTIINASNNDIVADTPGIYISPLTQYSQTKIINDDIDLRPLYYNPNTKEMFSSDGSGHFIDLNVSGIIKGPAELIIDPSPVFDNAGTVRIKGNLIVDGTQTVINSNVVEIEDNIISIKGSNQVSSGIEIKDGDDTRANFLYDGINDKWKTNNKDLDLGTGKLIADEVEAMSIGNVLLTQNITSGETVNINLANKLENTDDFQVSIFSVSLIDPLNSTGAAGVYLMTKIFDIFFYTVFIEKNIGNCNLSLATETGNLTVTGNNSGTSVQLEIKILNLNKKSA
jgi:hypothetical protein